MNIKKIALGKKCPRCRSRLRRRFGRKTWMYLAPGSKRYSCEECDTEYAYLFGMISFALTLSSFTKDHYRSGKRRRSGADRRQGDKSDVMSLDRRSGLERRICVRREGSIFAGREVVFLIL